MEFILDFEPDQVQSKWGSVVDISSDNPVKQAMNETLREMDENI